MELMMGSTAYMSLMLTLIFLINLTWVVLAVLLFMFGMQSMILYPAAGFWGVLFSFITIEAMMEPEGVRRIFCLPIDITSKWYPLCLYALFFLLGGADLDCLVGIMLGYAYSYGYLDSIMLSKQYISTVLESGSSHSSNTLGSGSSDFNATVQRWSSYCSNCFERTAVYCVAKCTPHQGFILSSAAGADPNAPQMTTSAPAGEWNNGSTGNRTEQAPSSNSMLPDMGGMSSWFGGGDNQGGEPPSNASRGAGDARGRYAQVRTIDSYSSAENGEAGNTQGSNTSSAPSVFSGAGNRLSSSSGGTIGSSVGGSTVDRDAARQKRLAALERAAATEQKFAPTAPVAPDYAAAQSVGVINPNPPPVRFDSSPQVSIPTAVAVPATATEPLGERSDNAVAADPQSVQLLQDMGFETTRAVDALQRSGNNLNEALSLLTQ